MSTGALERFECYGCKAEFGTDRLETHNGFSLCRECYGNAPISGIAEIATGEIIASLTPEQARDVTDRIRTALGVTWELVVEAWTGRAWAALGYGTWDSYIAAEFGTARLRLPAEERRDVVNSLRDAGMSTRAIAAAAGVSQSTVSNDLAGEQKCSPDLPAEDPDDSASVEPGSAPESATSTGSGATTDQEVKVTATITGRDGKNYPANKGKPIDAEDIAQIKLLVAAGKTAAEIAEATGRTYRSIASVMQRYDLKSNAPSSPAASAERVAKARKMAAEGYTSAQIGAAIGISSMSNFRATHGLDVPADAVIGRNGKKSVDADRVVSETVATLEGVVMSLGLIGTPATAGLDVEQIDDWATSLSDSLRLLNRFCKQLKEMTQ